MSRSLTYTRSRAGTRAGASKAGKAGQALRIAAERQAALAEHRASCIAVSCERCGRYLCRICGGTAAGYPGSTHPVTCDACATAKRHAGFVARVRDTIPNRFRWTFDASAETLVGRVRANGELIARGLASPPTADVVFGGDTGAGKTTLAVAMLDAWVRQDPAARGDARFVATYSLAGARARHPLGQGEAPDVLAAMRAPLLVVDDLGSEMDDHRNVLADVIFHRHNQELPTWVTTGFTGEQLTSRYGSAVMRRLLENGKRVQLGAKP